MAPGEGRGRALVEAAFAGVVAVVVFAAGAALKLRFNPASLVCPVPLVLVVVRQGAGAGSVLLAASTAVLAAAGIPGASALAFLLEVGVPALLMAVCLRRNLSPEWTVLLPAAALCAAFLVALGMRAGGVAGLGGAYRETLAEVDRTLVEAQEFYGSLGPQGDPGAGAEATAALRGFARKALPGLLAALNILVAAAVSWLAVALAARTVGTPPPPFSWTLPEEAVWAFIAGAAATLAPWGPWHIVGLNVLVVVGALYFLQGLSVGGFLLRRLEVPGSVRALGILVVVLWPPLTALAALAAVAVGLCDVWLAFRRADAPRSSGTSR